MKIDDIALSTDSNISWVMANIDWKAVLESIGCKVSSVRGEQVWGFCPDHHIFVGNESSHPKWTLHLRTGKTFCFTEGRGSNLVYTISRIRKCTTEETLDWLLGDADYSKLMLEGMRSELREIDKEKESDKRLIFSEVNEWIEQEKMTAQGYEYFMRPSGKPPTLIKKETVDRFECRYLTDGQYRDRVMIPFFHNHEPVGFAAREIYGKEKWLRINPGVNEKWYRKILYPSGFRGRLTLFNIDSVEKGDEVLLVEGPRDAMKLDQEGHVACAVLGTSLSDNQVMVLAEKGVSKVGVFFDGDEAGKKATGKVLKKLEPFFDTAIFESPSGLDPKNLEEGELNEILSDFAKKSSRN